MFCVNWLQDNGRIPGFQGGARESRWNARAGPEDRATVASGSIAVAGGQPGGRVRQGAGLFALLRWNP